MHREIISIIMAVLLVISPIISDNRGSGELPDEQSVCQVVEPSPILSKPVVEEIIPCEEHGITDSDYNCAICGTYIGPRYGFTEEEVYLLAQLICGDKNIDGDGEYDIDFQQKTNYFEVNKVLCVVMNRQRSDKFDYAETVRDVVLAEHQFAPFPKNLKAEPSEKALKVIRDWCYDYDIWDLRVQVIPEDHLYFSGRGGINVTR